MSAHEHTSPAPCIQPGEDYEAPPQAEVPLDGVVRFHHPSYDAPSDVLFHLPRVEKASTARWGVHHATALTACQIIANNAFDGYLAEQADGAPLDLPPDGILLRDKYFFIVPSATDRPYPVVPSFQEWRFPTQIPQVWKDAAHNVITSTRDSRCCVVTGRFMTENAHLIPKEHQEWFFQNGMGQYDPYSLNSTSCMRNNISLDCYLHRTMDKRMWAFAPRHGRFAVQTISVIEPLTYNHLCEFVSEYHGRHLATQAKLEFLFSRFAWAVLYFVKSFLLMPRPTTVLARYRVWEDGSLEQKDQNLPPDEIDQLFGGGGTRSASPRLTRSSSSRKRSRPEEDCDLGGSDSESWRDYKLAWEPDSDSESWRDYKLAWEPDSDESSSHYEKNDPFPEARGRQRTREEDDVRWPKRRRLNNTSKSSPLGPVPSLVHAGSCSSTSAPPSPEVEGDTLQEKEPGQALSEHASMPGEKQGT